jgi:alternate signal-mediated exported protein
MATIVRIPRHSTKTRRTVRAPRIRVGMRSLLASAAAVLAGVLIAVAGTSGSFALWNQAAPIADASVTSGSLALTIKYGSGAAGSTAAIPSANWSKMLPGDFVNQQVTLTSTGSVSANLTASIGSPTSPFQVRMASGTCPSTLLATTALATTASSLGTLAAGASQTYCVQVTLPASAASGAAGASNAFTITIGASS